MFFRFRVFTEITLMVSYHYNPFPINIIYTQFSTLSVGCVFITLVNKS